MNHRASRKSIYRRTLIHYMRLTRTQIIPDNCSLVSVGGDYHPCRSSGRSLTHSEGLQEGLTNIYNLFFVVFQSLRSVSLPYRLVYQRSLTDRHGLAASEHRFYPNTATFSMRAGFEQEILLNLLTTTEQATRSGFSKADLQALTVIVH